MKSAVVATSSLLLAISTSANTLNLPSAVAAAARQAMTEKHAPGVVVAVAVDGQPVLIRGYGVRDLATGEPVTGNTHFEIGSVTKQFTAAAIMQLLQQRKLSLDDPLHKYVPEYARGASVTLHQLLWQTSGIPNYVEVSDIVKLATTEQPSLGRIVGLIANRPLLFTPGSRWAYSNTNYFLLARVIEVASGQSYEQYLRQHIFAPAGMRDSGFVSDEWHFSDMARGYMMREGKIVSSPEFISGWAAGAGDIVSTAPDIVKWDDALLAGKVVPLSYVSMMRTSGSLASGKPTGYGMGWYIDKVAANTTLIWHNGGTFGYSADNNTYPTQNEIIVVMDNNIAADAEDVAKAIFSATH